jgi:hypothetical protein
MEKYLYIRLTIIILCISTQTGLCQPNSIQNQIREIGNENDDIKRVELLQKLKTHPDLPQNIESDLLEIIKQFHRWNTDKNLSYFGGSIRKNLDWDFGVSEESPLYPLTHLYRARMIIWYALEMGNVWRYPEVRKTYLDKARGELQKAKVLFPNNDIVRMYLGEPVSNPKTYNAPDSAPSWAIYQREGLERLADIIEWWIDNRERDNHEYGGGWGDDCEMWRWWVPVLIGFDDPKITAAQTRFSTALLNQKHLEPGYVTFMTDVEHSAEDLADALTPMMHLDPDNEIWKKKVFQLVDFMKTLWTGVNQRGFLQFKSTYFNAFEVHPDPKKACDTVYHPRTIQPALLYWQRNNDEELTKLISSWMDTWVDAASRSERGKPAGIIPSAIHWPSGKIGGLGENWWDPQNHGEPTLYEWPSAMDMMLNTLLLTYHMSGNEKYLQPIRTMTHIRYRYLQNPPTSTPKAGSQEWCAARMNLTNVLAKYRFLTENIEFDQFLLTENDPYISYRLKNNKERLEEYYKRFTESLRYNFEGFTSEVRYTDRVLRFPTLFGKDSLSPIPINTKTGTNNTKLLYSSTTGDPGDIGYFPLNRIRWLTPPRDIAALVTDANSSTFEAQLYHFGNIDRPMKAELYLLEKGKYLLQLMNMNNNQEIHIKNQYISIKENRTQISFILPSQTLCKLRISKEW